MIIEDPKPAGCEYDTDQRGYYADTNWYCHKEERDEKIAYFSTYYRAGIQKVTYRLRAETPGTFHVMPARAYLMYTEEIGGNSDEVILHIKEGQKEEITSKPVPVTAEEIQALQNQQSSSMANGTEEAQKQSITPLIGVFVLAGGLICILMIRKKGC